MRLMLTTTIAALRQKQAAMAGKLWADCGLHAGIVPGLADQVRPLGQLLELELLPETGVQVLQPLDGVQRRELRDELAVRSHHLSFEFGWRKSIYDTLMVYEKITQYLRTILSTIL